MNNKIYTDTQLRQALAKMLPEIIDTAEWTDMDSTEPQFYGIVWKQLYDVPLVFDTELLHLCWLVEESLTTDLRTDYMCQIYGDLDTEGTDTGDTMPDWKMQHCSWQQRVIALAKVKGVEL